MYMLLHCLHVHILLVYPIVVRLHLVLILFLLLFLQHLVEENGRIRGKIPELFAPLMGPHLERVDEVISPGLTLLRWTSLNIGAFVESVQESLKELELLINRASDILEFRIEGVLKEIQATPLCELPDNEPWTMDEFVARTQVSTNLIC